MNKRSHIHKKADSSSSNPVLSQFQSRPFIAQAKPQSQKPLTQTETENQEFQQQKFEATNLEMQAKYGTITPEGQERLSVLQAKMSGLLQTRLEQVSSFGRNFANIPISRPDASSQQAVQTKLTIGEPGDKYEQEADRVASQVVNQINAPASQQADQNVQREEISEEEKDLQMKPMLQLRATVGGMTATADLETGIQQARGGGQPLAANIRQPMEQAFGADFSKVKVHTDTQADQLNQSIQAKAFTTGQDVFFRQGTYEPGSRRGQELLAHELTHVVQQGGGAVQRSPQQKRQHKKHPATETPFVSSGDQSSTKSFRGIRHTNEAIMSRADSSNTRVQRVGSGSAEAAASEGGKLIIIVWSQGNTDLIGHVSLAVTNRDGTPGPVLGQSPSELATGRREEVANLLLGTQGKIYKNDHLMSKSHQMKIQEFPLNLAQRATIDTAINEARRNPPIYSIFSGHTCASWAVEVAAKAGIDVGGVYNYIAKTPKLIERASQPPTDELLKKIEELPSDESD